MAKYQIALNLRKFNYEQLASFARKIYKGFLASTVFTSPVPTTAQQLLDIKELEKRIAQWGTKSNRGSTLANALLIKARNVVRENLKSLAKDCIVKEPNDSTPAVEVGFVLKQPYSKNGLRIKPLVAPTNCMDLIKNLCE